MRQSIFPRVFLGFVLLLGMAGEANCASILYTGTGFNDGNSGATLGFAFTPNIDIHVDALGVLDGGSDGADLQVVHEVGLYTDTGTLLATTTVDNAGFVQDGFRFVGLVPADLTDPAQPLVLNASQTYVLAAYYPNGFAGDKLSTTNLDFSSHPDITLPGITLAAGGTSLVFPEVLGITNFVMSANLLFTPVPVPAALWLFVSGLLGLLGLSRRRQTA